MTQLLSLKDAAEHFPGKNKDLVRKALVNTGLVSHVRVGKSIFIHAESLEALISAKTPIRRAR